MPVKNNLLVIRMDVAALTQWVQVGGGKGLAGGVGFERIVEICGKFRSHTLREAQWIGRLKLAPAPSGGRTPITCLQILK
jgi:hypothetical protein